MDLSKIQGLTTNNKSWLLTKVFSFVNYSVLFVAGNCPTSLNDLNAAEERSSSSLGINLLRATHTKLR
jgi:hypothetical protein